MIARNRFLLVIISCISIMIFVLLNEPMFGMNTASWKMLGLIVSMILLWCFETIPLGVTALLPLVYAPLVGISPLSSVATSFAHPIIYLYLGGFVIGASIENTGLHRRIAMIILNKVGKNPKKQILAFMLGSAFVSMWMSNISTVIVLLPIALALISNIKGDNTRAFASPLLIGIAYAASIGGTATLVGSVPNILLKGFLEKQAAEYGISFLQWLIFAFPLALIILLIAYFILIRQFKLNKIADLDMNFDFKQELKNMGKMSFSAKIVLIVFILTAFSWIARPQINTILGINLTDEIISVLALLILFIFPVACSPKKPIVTIKDLNRLPWDIILLLGGGLALADLFVKTGLAVWFAQSVSGIKDIGTFGLITSITVLLKFLTELTSNTAISATFLPLFGSFAIEYGVHIYSITIPLVFTASLAFMLPVGTPPNAIVFGSGHVKIMEFVKAGLYLNIISIILVSLYSYIMIPIVFM